MLEIKKHNFNEKFIEGHIRQRLYENNSYITLIITSEFYPSLVNDSIVSGSLDIKVDLKDIHSLKELEDKKISGNIGSVTISVNNNGIWEHQTEDKFKIKLGKFKNRILDFSLETSVCKLDSSLNLISLYTTSTSIDKLKEVFSLDDFYDKAVIKKVGNSEIIKYYVKE